ncbi:APC family permease [Kerstersia gyiorum]|uniref:APC family permease n=1 Tax=Kerstersia gyiorum TaxID=206506 RepID=UPI00209D0AEB|nr:APC family permease [Kerstersia gyiorum]MCP1632117.1 amino acid transporter [Kerstersia gyiorum]MCP1681161.1 amino acid transporter [Kerstersia gyiorum]MCP1716826.1 amino acid transporter [Kerstersia gyiorum]MCW2185528.1 amino acid transporter [Kerstersia gyiorum]
MQNNETGQATGLNRNAIGLWSLVFFVLATNGPLTGLVGVAPTAILLGNGIGLPSSYLVAGIVYLLFCVGFVAMSRYIHNTGAFYAYISTGLGRPMGTAAAFLAIVAYGGLQMSCYGMIGFFLSLALSEVGINVAWWVASIVIACIVQPLSSRNVALNGKTLGILMSIEVITLIVFDLAVIGDGGGPESFSTASFTVDAFLSPGVGAVFAFVASSFIGIETTAIYAEEARDPTRTIPRATYISVVLITALLVLSSWLLIVSYGPSQAIAIAEQNPGTMWFDTAARVAGHWLSLLMNVLLITSLFSIVLSLQNTLSRYLYALGREQVFLPFFARLHPRHKTPHVASFVLAIVNIILLAAFGLASIDPMTGVLPLGSAPAALGILSVQVLTSLAVICFFQRDKRHTNIWQRLVAPLLSLSAMSTGVFLIATHMELLTGGIEFLNTAIPIGLVLVAAYGILVALWLRRYRPQRYAKLANASLDT